MRIIAFICSQNLPCSVDDAHKMIKSCQICNECKPCFYSPETDKSSTTYAAIKFRFQGTSTIKFHYHSTTFLTIVVKYSHFLFAIPCQDVKAFFIYKVLCPFLEKLRILIQIGVLWKEWKRKKEWLQVLPPHITLKERLSHGLVIGVSTSPLFLAKTSLKSANCPGPPFLGNPTLHISF